MKQFNWPIGSDDVIDFFSKYLVVLPGIAVASSAFTLAIVILESGDTIANISLCFYACFAALLASTPLFYVLAIYWRVTKVDLSPGPYSSFLISWCMAPIGCALAFGYGSWFAFCPAPIFGAWFGSAYARIMVHTPRRGSKLRVGRVVSLRSIMIALTWIAVFLALVTYIGIELTCAVASLFSWLVPVAVQRRAAMEAVE